MTTNLTKYFTPEDYDVVRFFSSTNYSMWEAADRLGLTPDQRVGDRKYPPYIELKNGAPEIYAAKPDHCWITFNVLAHGAAMYTSVPGFRRSQPAVLLWRRGEVHGT